MIAFLLDISPELGAAGIVAVLGFFLIFVAIAYIAFRMMRKTVRMAFRMAVVAVILLVALIGSVYIYWNRTSNTPRSKPQPTRSR
jgi:hypothetical protein